MQFGGPVSYAARTRDDRDRDGTPGVLQQPHFSCAAPVQYGVPVQYGAQINYAAQAPMMIVWCSAYACFHVCFHTKSDESHRCGRGTLFRELEWCTDPARHAPFNFIPSKPPRGCLCHGEQFRQMFLAGTIIGTVLAGPDQVAVTPNSFKSSDVVLHFQDQARQCLQWCQ